MRTTFPVENGGSANLPKVSPNISEPLGSENESNVKFPKRLRYRGKGRVLATIYKRVDCYRHDAVEKPGEVARWVLSFEDYATVIEPRGLRDKLRKTAREIRAKYSAR